MQIGYLIQGFVLSPLLFSLDISGLGNSLYAMKEGVNYEVEIISPLFFADDLVLIKDKETGNGADAKDGP